MYYNIYTQSFAGLSGYLLPREDNQREESENKVRISYKNHRFVQSSLNILKLKIPNLENSVSKGEGLMKSHE